MSEVTGNGSVSKVANDTYFLIMIPIYKASQMKAIDAFTIKNQPVSSIDLMERAVTAFTAAFSAKFKHDKVIVVAGPGNNGGDALGIARHLLRDGYRVSAFLFQCGHRLSVDCETNKNRLQQQYPGVLTIVDGSLTLPDLTNYDVLIDGLFGSGLNRPLSGDYAFLVKQINTFPGRVVSVDIPSGLMAEDNTGNTPDFIVKADLTFTFQFPKLAFSFAENEPYVGKWTMLNIGLMQPDDVTSNVFYVTGHDVSTNMRQRSSFAHKGTEGHALLKAGKTGMAGAALLAAKACLRAGVGKLTVATQEQNRVILQLGVPEAILSLNSNEIHNNAPLSYQSVGVGPGIGTNPNAAEELEWLLRNVQKPMVIDADALNIMAEKRNLMNLIPPLSILTPHKLELRRLLGKSKNDYDELMMTRDFAKEHNLFVIIKGAFSKIVCPNGHVYINSTGNPGMATAGSGDVLTGILTALLAQGYPPEKAAFMGVYIHGLAGDFAAKEVGVVSLIASDIVSHIPSAFKSLTDCHDGIIISHGC